MARIPPSLPRRHYSSLNVRTLPSIAEDEEAHMPLRIPPRSPRSPRRARTRPRPPYVPDYVLYEQVVKCKETVGRAAECSVSDGVGESVQEVTCCRGWKRSWCWVFWGMLGMVVLAAALVVGLTIGLNKKHHARSRVEPDTFNFPAGSYTFNTTLKNTTKSCTSNPSTWRCYPYNIGSAAKFFWNIHPPSPDYYTISSSNNPFAPSFSNITMTLHEANSSNEHLTFSLTMTKTVVPSENLTADNRAALCEFSDTILEATLWTRRGANGTVTESSAGVNFADWPGDVEITQRKNHEAGHVRCEDEQGIEIPGVKAESGECLCEYVSANLI